MIKTQDTNEMVDICVRLRANGQDFDCEQSGGVWEITLRN